MPSTKSIFTLLLTNALITVVTGSPAPAGPTMIAGAPPAGGSEDLLCGGNGQFGIAGKDGGDTYKIFNQHCKQVDSVPAKNACTSGKLSCSPPPVEFTAYKDMTCVKPGDTWGCGADVTMIACCKPS